jgi:hypothetical protein
MVDPVITKAAYILFFRRVSSGPRTLESLRSTDDRCLEDSEWAKELLCTQEECHGAEAAAHSSATCAVDGRALLTAADDCSDSDEDCSKENFESKEELPFYNL